MRFIFLTLGYTPDIDGGGYRYATEVAEGLGARGHEVHAVYPNPGNQFPTREMRARVQLHRVPKAAGGMLGNWRAAVRESRRIVDELLGETPGPTLLFSHHAYLSPALRGLPFVMILQGPWAEEHRFALQARKRGPVRRAVDSLACRAMHRVERRSVAAARLVFVASEYSRGKLAEWHPGLHPEVEVIGGGADFKRFSPPADRATLRRERGLADADTLFLAVRRLDPRMGLGHLVEAFAQVAGQFAGARLWIAGKGSQKAELEERINAAGLAGRAKLLGFVTEDELPRLYSAADCVVMPSLDLEGFGLATAEALACGTPVLASRAGANTELVAPLDPRLLFQPGRTDSLTTALKSVLDRSLPLPDRDRCASYARASFRWDRPCEAIERAHARFAVVSGARRGA
jgi:glycosyltransferase involved in cell wall biosynthesis